MKTTRAKVASWLVFCLSTLVLCNLNGLVGAYLGIHAPFSPLILLLCVVILLISGIRSQRFNLGIVFLSLFFFLFFVNGVFVGMLEGASRSDFKQFARDIITSVLIVWTYYVYVRNLQTEAELNRFMQLIFGLFIFTTCFGIGESMLGLTSAFRDNNYERSLGFFGNPNETGLQCTFSFLLACYLFIKRKMHSLLFLAAVVVAIYGAILSFSKAAMLISGILLIFFLCYNFFYLRRLNRKVARRFLLAMAVVIAFVSFVVLPNFNDFYGDISYAQRRRINLFWELVIEGKISAETTSGRTVVQAEALELALERPVFGYGMQSFSTSRLFQAGYGVHNTYLKIWGEGGLFALLAWFVFLFYGLFKGVYRSRFPDAYFIVGVLMILSIYFMVSHTVLSRKFVMPLLAIAVALIYHKSLEVGKVKA